MYNLLTEPLIRAETTTPPGPDPAELSLPELLARLIRDEIRSLPGLPAHQEAFWHCFLVQTAYLALEDQPLTEPLPATTEAWQLLLRRLTAAEYPEDEPWQLAVADWTQPAFLQPPLADPALEREYRKPIPTPDGLDLLFLSKNHDRKQEQMQRSRPEDWIFALTAVQTGAGFAGAGNYGICRMNGGLGSRALLSLTPSLRPGPRFRRDLTALRQYGPAWWQEHSPMSPQGRKLLALEPWHGRPEEALPLDQLHPAAVEICRRVRLTAHETSRRLSGWQASIRAARVQAAPCGLTGDPWSPENRENPAQPKILTLPPGGFNERRLTQYMTSPHWIRTPLQQPTPEELAAGQPMYLTSHGLVRGQGKTQGCSSWNVPLTIAFLRRMKEEKDQAMNPPPSEARRPGRGQARGTPTAAAPAKAAAKEKDSPAEPPPSSLAELADERRADQDKARQLLAASLHLYAAGGDPEIRLPEGRRLIQPAMLLLEQALEKDYLAEFQALATAADPAAVRIAWLQDKTVPAMRRILRQAPELISLPQVKQRRAQAAAGDLLATRLRRQDGFPEIFPPPPETGAGASASDNVNAEAQETD